MLMERKMEIPGRVQSEFSRAPAVIIATRGRPDSTTAVVTALSRQTLIPSVVVFSATEPQDVALPKDHSLSIHVLYGEPGLTKQRNRALTFLEERDNPSIIIFFDDDFEPAVDWVEQVQDLFARNPDVVGLTGRVLLDGARGDEIELADAQRRLALHSTRSIGSDDLRPVHSLYGCNMAFRMARLPGLRFDERMPLYGWQEDQDFSCLAARNGAIRWSPRLVGVHLGVKGARLSGLRFGISQIINPLYLLQKGTISLYRAARLVSGNFSANLIGSIANTGRFDRRGRLRGNLIGIVYAIRGKIAPECVLEH